MRHIAGCGARSLRYASALIRLDERRKSASQEIGNEKTLFSSGPPQAVKGKAQTENVFCRAAGERRPVRKRDESPGETEGVSPGAILRAGESQSRSG